MNLFIRQAMETGHLDKWEIYSGGGKKYESEWHGPVVLTVEHLSASLVIYSVAIVLSVLAFIGEKLTFKNIMRNNHRGWKFLHEYIFSTERIIWRDSYQDINSTE